MNASPRNLCAVLPALVLGTAALHAQIIIPLSQIRTVTFAGTTVDGSGVNPQGETSGDIPAPDFGAFTFEFLPSASEVRSGSVLAETSVSLNSSDLESNFLSVSGLTRARTLVTSTPGDDSTAFASVLYNVTFRVSQNTPFTLSGSVANTGNPSSVETDNLIRLSRVGQSTPLFATSSLNQTFSVNGNLEAGRTYRLEFSLSAQNALGVFGGTGSSSGNLTLLLVPEPETYAIAATCGLLGFGLWRRCTARR
jgi:hypothetical protein